MKVKIFREYFFEKYWKDPVWSKVISAGIISILGSVFVLLYSLIKSFYNNISFATVFNQTISFLKSSTQTNNSLIILAIIILSYISFSFFLNFAVEIIKKIRTKSKEPETKVIRNALESITLSSTAFFSYRLSSSFPGQRDLTWYEPKVAVERFKTLFQEPLRFQSGGHDCVGDPIWWFRGGSSAVIEKFKALSKTKILIGLHEIEIKRIAVFISDSYYKSYIYVEAKGEKQTGLYDYKEADILRHIETFGYSSEEFGLFNNKPITRQQYDDGATVIKNKVIETNKAELRERYLSDYNFIITAKQSPYNSRKFDRESKSLLNSILKGELKPESLFEYLNTFNKQEY